MNAHFQWSKVICTLALVALLFLLSACEKQTMVAQDFEDETDPAMMTLEMQTWVWQETQYNNDTSLKPQQVGIFTLNFSDDQRVQIGTDCNKIQGAYNVDNRHIEFTNMISTRMFCKDSQEQLFKGMLENVSTYFFTSNGQLILKLQSDSGSMIFQ